MKRSRIAGLALALAGAAACGGGPTEPAASTAGDADSVTVCRGVDRCRVVAQVDVDGDRQPDEVGWVARKAEGAAVIRVRTDDGMLLRKRLDVSLWFDTGVWGGAAAIDGRRGVEMLVGTQMGAHTPVYTMLTYRGGALVVEESPAQGERWFVDGAWSAAVGWNRDVVDGRVLMRYTFVTRSPDGSFDGTVTTYRWKDGRWVLIRERDRHYKNARTAVPAAGWHVRGLERFPGLT